MKISLISPRANRNLSSKSHAHLIYALNLSHHVLPMAHERASSTLLEVVAFASRSLTPPFTVFSGFRPTSNKRLSLSLSFPAARLPNESHQQSQATELRRRTTAQKGMLGGSVVGCPLKGREKAWPMEGHCRVPSLFSTRSNQALRPATP